MYMHERNCHLQIFSYPQDKKNSDGYWRVVMASDVDGKWCVVMSSNGEWWVVMCSDGQWCVVMDIDG